MARLQRVMAIPTNFPCLIQVLKQTKDSSIVYVVSFCFALNPLVRLENELAYNAVYLYTSHVIMMQPTTSVTHRNKTRVSRSTISALALSTRCAT